MDQLWLCFSRAADQYAIAITGFPDKDKNNSLGEGRHIYFGAYKLCVWARPPEVCAAAPLCTLWSNICQITRQALSWLQRDKPLSNYLCDIAATLSEQASGNLCAYDDPSILL